MIRSLLLAACFCALALLCAEARPSHHHFERKHKMLGLYVTGCSQPDMRPCGPKNDLSLSRKTRQNLSDWNRAGRPRAWCGWWMGRHLGMHDRRLWRALAWRHVGRAAHGPAIGVVAIWSRGKGRGHVGIITGKTVHGWVVLSGNDGNAVRERVRSVSNAIAFRWP
jgi:hypothetical protein